MFLVPETLPEGEITLLSKRAISTMVKLFRSTYGWSKEFTDMNGFDYTNNYNARMQYAVLQTALVRQGLKLYMNNTERWIKWQADIESLLAEDFDMILLFLYTGLGLIG